MRLQNAKEAIEEIEHLVGSAEQSGDIPTSNAFYQRAICTGLIGLIQQIELLRKEIQTSRNS